ncbi:OLC1v1010734C1 [Oldenlandia corymbosa var. corymbosa]|uniref:OLC1v1010734C1 n=1 Tax=Oldenlandia corymbosa var. corymbosa TaxID=529605 RepID=A0AAV1DVE9_OLDCO|nr:OLC1v1010734C1 [Oldenlandia corymbosa var. corymbosa]
MAVDLYSDTSSSRGVSPRISFSHDLCQSDGVPIEQYIRTTSSSSIDFDFCVFRGSFDQESSSADELFSDGKILPIEVKRKLGSTPPKKSLPADPPKSPQFPESSIRVNNYHNATKSTQIDQSPSEKSGEHSSESEEKTSKSSFWRFKRSYSVNCGSGYGRTLCPLPLLSRSNSTGSTPNVKRSSSGKDNNFSNNKQHVTKPPLITSLKQSQSASSTSGNHHPKPPLKKSYGSSYGNGVKVTPLLNVPSPSMFGLGSIFSAGKDKMKKK